MIQYITFIKLFAFMKQIPKRVTIKFYDEKG